MTAPLDTDVEASKVRKPPNKGLSKYRRGFPVKLSQDNILMLHITYLWMQKHGENTPEIDALIPTLPPYQETDKLDWRAAHRHRTHRIRGPEVGPLCILMERAATLPFTSCGVFRSRVAQLKALTAMDLMVDAERE